MIINCPNCNARFVVDDSAITPLGRQLRCGECKKEWRFTPGLGNSDNDEPDEDDEDTSDELLDELNDMISTMKSDADEPEDENADEPETDDDFVKHVEAAADDDDIEDIPDSVKPIDDDNPKFSKKKFQFKLSVKPESVISNVIVFGVLLLVVTIILKKQSYFIHAWPNSIALYDLIGGMSGKESAIKGEGLVIDNMHTKIDKQPDGRYKLIGNAKIINLTGQKRYIPPVLISVHGEGKTYEEWVVKLPYKAVRAEDIREFSFEYEGISLEGSEVRMRFLPFGQDQGKHSDEHGHTEDGHTSSAHDNHHEMPRSPTQHDTHDEGHESHGDAHGSHH